MGAGWVDTLDGRHFRNLRLARKEGGAKPPAAGWEVISQADLILFVGPDPAQDPPILASLLKGAALKNQARLALIGPGAVNGQPGLRLPISLEEMPGLLQDLHRKWNGEQESGPWPEPAWSRLAAWCRDSQKPLIVVGTSLTGAEDTAALSAALGLAAGEHGGSLFVIKPAANSAGAWGMGLAAAEPPPARAGLRGGLLLLAEEDLCDPDLLPPPDSLKFLAVVTPYWHTRATERAHLLLPKAAWLETAATYCPADGSGDISTAPVLEPPPGVRPGAEVLAALFDLIPTPAT